MDHCKEIRQLIWLAIYNEIKPEEQAILDKHIKNCPECQIYFKESNHLVQLVNQKIQLKPTAELIEQSRDELHHRLMLATQPKYKPTLLSRLGNFLTLELNPTLRLATTVSVLIVGLLLGRFLSFKSITDKSFQSADFTENYMTGVESVQFDPETKHVSLVFNTVETKAIHGDLDRPDIQHLLAKTLMTDQRPNIRLKTVNALTNTKSFDEQVLDALIHVLHEDQNPGIRLKAIKVLKRIPISESVKEMMTRVFVRVLLKEQNSAIRIEAIDGLSKLENNSVAPVVYDAAKDDSSEYVRNKAAKMLERLENPSIPE